jgi:hypothetical protein
MYYTTPAEHKNIVKISHRYINVHLYEKYSIVLDLRIR